MTAGARAPAGADGEAADRSVWQVQRSTADVSRTRRQLRALLEQRGVHPDTRDVVLLVAHELVVNGVEHGRTEVRLTVTFGSAGVRIDVDDGSTRPPQLRPVDPTAVRGRGLQMVDGLAAGWGWQADGTGKTVWAEVATGSQSGPAA